MDRATKWRFGVTGLLLAGMLAATAYESSKPVKGKDMCTGKPGGNVAILVDHSEAITPTTRDEIRRRVVQLVGDRKLVKPNDRVSVFLMDGRLDSVKPVFTFCRPDEEGNPLIENPEVLAALFQKVFVEKLAASVDQPAQGATNSPILETLSVISRTGFFDTDRRRLVVFSDLIQNSGAARLYGCQVGGDAQFRRYVQDAPVYAPPVLDSRVPIDLHQIPRPRSGTSQRCVVQFWEKAFAPQTPSFLPLP